MNGVCHLYVDISFPVRYKDREGNSPLMHHVAKGRIYARDLKDGMTLETALGTKLKVTKYSNGVSSAYI